MSACALPVVLPYRTRPAPVRTVAASAPMRVSFAGGGSDLPPFVPGIGGRIVGTALDLRVRAVVEPFDRGWVRLELKDAVATRRSEDARRADLTFRLLEAALDGCGIDGGVRLRVDTDVVPGAGLGGSAAAAVAMLAALRASIDADVVADDLARDAVHLERDRLGLACGSQDQIFASFGGLLDLRIDEGGRCVRRDVIAAPRPMLDTLERGLLLIDTLARRVSGEVLDRAPQSRVRSSNTEFVAAAHDVSRGFAEGSLDVVLEGMQRSATAKFRRDPDANADAAALDKKLRPLGARVVRACGAGAGGHVLVWAPPETHDALVGALDGAVARKAAIAAQGVRFD